jgi:hypothetical protein
MQSAVKVLRIFSREGSVNRKKIIFNGFVLQVFCCLVHLTNVHVSKVTDWNKKNM